MEDVRYQEKEKGTFRKGEFGKVYNKEIIQMVR